MIHGIVPIFRGQAEAVVLDVLTHLVASPVQAIELCASDEHTPTLLQRIAEHYADRFVVGVGTVFSSLTVAGMAAAGAQFIRSPNVNVHVIRATKEHGMLSVPGAYTPTEVRAASDYGASIVDLFPAAALSVEFIETLQAVQPDVPLMASGGVGCEQVARYAQLGFHAVGMSRAFFAGADNAEHIAARIAAAAQAWSEHTP